MNKTAPKPPRLLKCSYKPCNAWTRTSVKLGTGRFCDSECGSKKAIANLDKIRKREQQKAVAATRADKQAHKKKAHDFKDKHWGTQFKLTVAVARRLGNLLDLKLTCICCGRPRTSQFCGGHCKTMKARPDIAFDVRNIHGQQNKNCNEGMSGNITGFKAGLLERYGQPLLDFLEIVQEMKRWTPQTMKKLRAIYAAEIRHIEKGNAPTRDWRSPDYDLLSLVTEKELLEGGDPSPDDCIR